MIKKLHHVELTNINGIISYNLYYSDGTEENVTPPFNESILRQLNEWKITQEENWSMKNPIITSLYSIKERVL